MEKEIAKLIHSEKPTLSEMSVKTYANCIIKIMEFLKTTSYDDLYKDAKKVVKVLHDRYDKPNTIKTKLASLIVYLRCIKTDKTAKEIDTAGWWSKMLLWNKPTLQESFDYIMKKYKL